MNYCAEIPTNIIVAFTCQSERRYDSKQIALRLSSVYFFRQVSGAYSGFLKWSSRREAPYICFHPTGEMVSPNPLITKDMINKWVSKGS